MRSVGGVGAIRPGDPGSELNEVEVAGRPFPRSFILLFSSEYPNFARELRTGSQARSTPWMRSPVGQPDPSPDNRAYLEAIPSAVVPMVGNLTRTARDGSDDQAL
jgi:hypothetical protein